MKVLVTGANGFIGRQCCIQLKNMGYEVHAISSRYNPDTSVYWHKVNLLDDKQIKGLLEKVRPSHLLHLAWYAEPGKFWTSKKNYCWLKATLTLFEEFIISGGKRAVVAGTCAEYDWNSDKYIEGITPLAPQTIYGICKHSLQMILSSYASSNDISFSWGRIFSLYGPYENPARLIASVVTSLINNKTIICKNGELIRDYLHVNDVASAFVALIGSDIEGPINIGSGQGIMLTDLVREVEKKMQKFGYLKIEGSSGKNSDAPIIVADTSKIRSIGWKPSYNLDRGLEDTIDWFIKN